MKERSVIPLQGIRSDGEVHPPRFERVPPPPRNLSKRAKEIWRDAAKRLHGLAILTTWDTPILETYCHLVEEAEILSKNPRARRLAARTMKLAIEYGRELKLL